jgi:hypothetical protein
MKIDPLITNSRIKNRYKTIKSEFVSVHGQKYNYELAIYKGQKSKITIICPDHAEFQQKPENHLKGGCKKCADEQRGKQYIDTTGNSFVTKAKKIHGDKYDYTKVIYKGKNVEIEILCPIHGVFLQKPDNHLAGSGCQKCGLISKARKKSEPTRKMFIERARSIHGNTYDYSKAIYINKDTNVMIICPIHGEFKQRPHNHTFGKQGCPKCGAEKALRKKKIFATNNFYKKSRLVHGDKYDYSKVVYESAKEDVVIICPFHGEFYQTPDTHTQGAGCAKRAGILRITNSDFIDRANAVHSNKYDYSKVHYVNAREEVTIICPEHGEFQQISYNHLTGRGCPSCATSGFDKEKPAILYYLSVEDGLAYKIGITNRTVEERFLGEMDKIKILKIWKYDKGKEALEKELEILKKYSSFLYKGAPILSSGNTELFVRNVLLI